MSKSLVVSLFLLVIVFSSAAVAEPVVDNLINKALEKKLYRQAFWNSLLHYKSEPGSQSGLRSEIISAGFFLAADGRDNPKSELIASLKGFYQPSGDNLDLHPQCQFVARFKWLEKTLGWGAVKPPAINCEKFNAYSNNNTIESISLVFATGYLGNPASYYGHILLKLNSNRSAQGSDLLDQSVNFGAIVPDNENQIAYIAKGLFGGYESVFSHEKFYRNNHIYVENEMRDMWEYVLELNKAQVDEIVAHSWELLGREFVYYFLKENCAYRMAELLELVVDKPLYSRSLPWSMPAYAFERLAEVKIQGRPLVKQVKWIPSRQNLFYSKYKLLDEKLQQVLSLLVENIDFSHKTYLLLSDREKIELIDTLFDYYEYRIVLEADDKQLKQIKRQLLVERFKISAVGGLNVGEKYEDEPPRNGPLPSMMRYGVLTNSVLGSGASLRLRPAYFDMLSLDKGRLPNSHLTMFDIELVLLDKMAAIKKLDIVSVETLNVSRTGLPGDGGLAWKIKFGFENQNLSCIDCDVFKVGGGIGKAVSIFSSRSSVYSMFEFNAQTEYQNYGQISMALTAGVLGYPLTSWKSRLKVTYQEYLDGMQSEDMRIKWENRFGSSRDWDIRFDYERNVESEIAIGLSLYW
ncbi:MAG: DUF4105 domain-containing protein [Gammaproteobacteria bacterium]|nr:DUF4105 domain-containing protein [Gammaproteobacteria bacterium]